MKKITQKILTKLPIRYNMTGLISVILLFIYGVVGSILIMKLNLIDSRRIWRLYSSHRNSKDFRYNFSNRRSRSARLCI